MSLGSPSHKRNRLGEPSDHWEHSVAKIAQSFGNYRKTERPRGDRYEQVNGYRVQASHLLNNLETVGVSRVLLNWSPSLRITSA